MSYCGKHGAVVLSQVLLVGWFLAASPGSLAQGDTWATKASMPTARLGLAACAVEGKIYAIGGYAEASAPVLRTVEEYDPATDTWTSRAPMPLGRKWLACSVVDGKIYAIGGQLTGFGSASLDITEEYDPATDTWTPKASMPTPRKGLSTAVVDGKIYAVGGASESEALGIVEMYDPATNTWTRVSDMQMARALLSTGVVHGKLYAIGGPLPGEVATPVVEEYDPATDTWTPKADMPTERWGLATSTVDGMIYAIGGASGFASYSVVEAYDPATDTWTQRRNMDIEEPGDRARWGLATSVVNGKIYAIGGASDVRAPHTGIGRVQEYTAPVVTGVEDPEGELPGSIRLHHNYPNPFTTSTQIRFELSEVLPVRLVVYDVSGRAVQVLVDEVRAAGWHEVVFEAGDLLPSGLYPYRLETPNGNLVQRMQLVK